MISTQPTLFKKKEKIIIVMHAYFLKFNMNMVTNKLKLVYSWHIWLIEYYILSMDHSPNYCIKVRNRDFLLFFVNFIIF